jgi:hypothetical protein
MEHPAYDDEAANRLLRGSLPPEDAPAGLEAVAALFRAAHGPVTDDEVADPRGVVQALSTDLRDRAAAANQAARTARGRRRLRRLVASPALVAALVATGAATAAAATGELPRPVQSAVAGVASHAGVDLPEPAAHHTRGHHDDGGGDATTAEAPGSTSPAAGATSPIDGPARAALCHAYASGNGAERGGKADARPFRDLADAAAAANESVDAYCSAPAPNVTTPTDATPSDTLTTSTTTGTSDGGARHGPPATLGNGAPHPSTPGNSGASGNGVPPSTVVHGDPHGAPPGHASTNAGNANGNGRGGNPAGHP